MPSPSSDQDQQGKGLLWTVPSSEAPTIYSPPNTASKQSETPCAINTVPEPSAWKARPSHEAAKPASGATHRGGKAAQIADNESNLDNGINA